MASTPPASRPRGNLTVTDLRDILRHTPEDFEATIDEVVASCRDERTVDFWLAMKEFARRGSDE
jgi:hypothetical protein